LIEHNKKGPAKLREKGGGAADDVLQDTRYSISSGTDCNVTLKPQLRVKGELKANQARGWGCDVQGPRSGAVVERVKVFSRC